MSEASIASQKANQPPQLVIGISSSALFDASEADAVYRDEGVEAYSAYQLSHERQALSAGVAYPFVKKLLKINQEAGCHLVEVIVLSRNSPDSGLRIFNSIEAHGLDIVRAAFTNGQSPYPYLQALGAHLFLSTNACDVRDAIAQQCAAATLLPKPVGTLEQQEHADLRIAFDGDAVLFSDELEKIYQENGMNGVIENERANADIPLTQGPFHHFFSAVSRLQRHEAVCQTGCIRTALVTARSAPAHSRVIKTLRAWGVKIDEAFFLGGMDKSPILKSFQPDIFFDDHPSNCARSADLVATGHVPYGVNND